MEKTCFVIMSFAHDFDSVYHQAIKPAMEEKGYRCHRADDDPRPNNIPSEIIRSIIDADIVIADLSEPKPNVYYEVAVSHCTGNKTITITSDIKTLPFDLTSFRIREYGRDSNGLRLLKADLRDAVRALEIDRGLTANNLVQEAGRQFFDLRKQVTDNLRAITAERDRTIAFSQFMARRGDLQDNSDVVAAVANQILQRVRPNEPLLASVCGSGAAGKSTMCRSVAQHIRKLTNERYSVQVLPTDSYQYSRAERALKNVIGFSPQGHDLDRLVADIEDLLLHRRHIEVRPYNHKTGEHDAPVKVHPADIIIVEGVYSFYPRIAPFSHGLRYYLFADKAKAKEHKFLADFIERGYDIQTAFKHAEAEYDAYESHILPMMRLADFVIEVDEYWKYKLPNPTIDPATRWIGR